MLRLLQWLLGLRAREPTPEERRATLQRIAALLRHPVGVKEVLDEMTWWCKSEKDVRMVRSHLEWWLAGHTRRGDALWRYDSGRDQWENLYGEWGIAVVRNSEVVHCLMVAMN
jgi:hypothetical protein